MRHCQHLLRSYITIQETHLYDDYDRICIKLCLLHSVLNYVCIAVVSKETELTADLLQVLTSPQS